MGNSENNKSQLNYFTKTSPVVEISSKQVKAQTSNITPPKMQKEIKRT